MTVRSVSRWGRCCSEWVRIPSREIYLPRAARAARERWEHHFSNRSVSDQVKLNVEIVNLNGDSQTAQIVRPSSHRQKVLLGAEKRLTNN